MSDRDKSISGMETMRDTGFAIQDASLGDLPTMTLNQKGIGRVDRYELLEKLGEGGFGAVYGAKDTVAGILVALKALPSEVSCDVEEMASIRDNFALVSRLSHPNIAGVKHLHRVNVVDARAQTALGVRKNDYLVVMEYAPGATLFAWRRALPEQKMDFFQALEICRPIADALDYAHSQRVLHRDVKPKNVMVSFAGHDSLKPLKSSKPLKSGDDLNEAGGRFNERSDSTFSTVKVLDFGLAAEIRSSMSRKSKEPQNSKSGTPLYMAPEQWRGTMQNAAADQYALAVLFYELACGEVPFKSAFDTGNFEIMCYAVVNNLVEPIPELTKQQNAVLQRALAKEPQARFASCREFVEALAGGKSFSPRKSAKIAKGEWPQKTQPSLWRAGLRDSGATKWQKGTKKILVGLCLAALVVGAGVWFSKSAVENRQSAMQQSAETQAQVNSLIREAQTALAAGDLDAATEKAQSVLKLDVNNSDASELLLEVEKKAGEIRAREVKIDAEMAVEKLERDITDRGQGFGEKFEALKNELLIAQDAYAGKSWGQAFTAYKGVAGNCDALRTLEVDRKDAKTQRTAAENKQKAAEGAKADQLAKKEWDGAVGAALEAARAFEEGRFEEASKGWKTAVESFQGSEEMAGAISLYRKAKEEWDLATKEHKETQKEIEQYAAVEWAAAEKAARLGEAAASEPVRGKQHYEAALANYAEAVKKTKPNLVPRLGVECQVSGVEITVAATDGRDLRPPNAAKDWTLEKGKTYTLTVSKKGWKTHTETLTADWNGVKTKPITLEEWNGPEEGEKWTSPSTGMEFVWIPALKSWVGKYEVTNGEYRKKEPGHDSKDYNGNSLNGDRQPVVQVNFDDAQAYAKWLTERDRAAGHIPDGTAYRLPTKDEFTAFAQCGDGREYPWGNQWPPSSGQAGNYADRTAKGVFSEWGVIRGYDDGKNVACNVEASWANPWGLYGVGGNVWECTTERAGGGFDAWRGASWYDYGQDGLRCLNRFDDFSSLRNRNFGFRLVLFCPEAVDAQAVNFRLDSDGGEQEILSDVPLQLAAVILSPSNAGSDTKKSAYEYLFFDDFNGGINLDDWNVKTNGFSVQSVDGVVYIKGKTFGDGWGGSGGRGSLATKQRIPCQSFIAEVSFKVPRFSGSGAKLIYLQAKGSASDTVAIYCFPEKNYALQTWVPPAFSKGLSHFGDEASTFHRMKLIYLAEEEKLLGFVDEKYAGELPTTFHGDISFTIGPATGTKGMDIEVCYDDFSVRPYKDSIKILDVFSKNKVMAGLRASFDISVEYNLLSTLKGRVVCRLGGREWGLTPFFDDVSRVEQGETLTVSSPSIEIPANQTDPFDVKVSLMADHENAETALASDTFRIHLETKEMYDLKRRWLRGSITKEEYERQREGDTPIK